MLCLSKHTKRVTFLGTIHYCNNGPGEQDAVKKVTKTYLVDCETFFPTCFSHKENSPPDLLPVKLFESFEMSTQYMK